MKNKKHLLKNKEESGITLIALSITIIVLLIIVGVSFNIGTSSIKEARDNKLITEIGMINHAILERYTKNSLTGEEYPGEVITVAGINLNSVISEINSKATETITRKDNEDSNYYYLTNDNNGLSDLGIKDTEDEYIVNYETGEVINYTKKVTESGKALYIYSVNKTN